MQPRSSRSHIELWFAYLLLLATLALVVYAGRHHPFDRGTIGGVFILGTCAIWVRLIDAKRAAARAQRLAIRAAPADSVGKAVPFPPRPDGPKQLRTLLGWWIVAMFVWVGFEYFRTHEFDRGTSIAAMVFAFQWSLLRRTSRPV